MRTYPAEWPVTDGLNDTLPTIYLHVLDSAWPPANDDLGTPAGWCEVTDWNIDCGLVAPLMPGQVTASPNYLAAVGGCKIPQPEGHHLAPWRPSPDRTPSTSLVQLWASHDGPTGATAMLLGQFRLDPIKGKLSDPFLSVTFIQDAVRMDKEHDLPASPVDPGNLATAFSPTRLLEVAAEGNGFTLNATADFPAQITSSYFPGKTTELAAMQSIVSANLGAMFLSMDGTTIEVKDPDYLLGAGTVVDTIDVSDDLDDLSWSQDPNAAVDRIEVTYRKVTYSNEVPVLTAAKGMKLGNNDAADLVFDPKHAIGPNNVGTIIGIETNTHADGTGSSFAAPYAYVMLSSGRVALYIVNDTDPATYYLVDTAGHPTSFGSATVETSSDDQTRTLAWGAATEDATNTLTFDLGLNIQRKADAQAILDRIVTRVTQPAYVLDDVQLPLDFRRELADLYIATETEVGFNSRAMVTGLKLAGTKDSIVQTASLAIMPLRISDLNAVWDTAHPGATIADFNTKWAGKTVSDFNADPLGT